ncbi:MAG TPA: hypothetical protein VLE23_01250 [Geminicoccaceae bacterium]|nr:hypothetical protein [Geminicoccaceae bacterium]
MRWWAVAAAALVVIPSRFAFAGEADVVAATLTPTSGGSWRIEVTVAHADEGWDHYADAWEVVAPDGSVLDTRTLLHPHVDEQPFTRALSGVAIPGDVVAVTIRARDSVHGHGGRELTVAVPRD